jgi:hypothetical protein
MKLCDCDTTYINYKDYDGINSVLETSAKVNLRNYATVNYVSNAMTYLTSWRCWWSHSPDSVWVKN